MEQQKKDEDEAPAVQVYVRPLEVTVPSDIFTSSSSPPPLPTEKKSVWSTMTTRIEAETSVRQWSTPTVKTEEGQPPGPQDHPSTKEGKAREGAVKSITPSYKTSPFKSELNLGRTGHLPNEKGDYKMSMRQEDYKLTVIDPKVKSSANMPNHSMRLPDPKREIVSDFPSQHSKRSNIKLEPLEQRRFKSSESRPITTSNYLTESVERHRDMEASKLREFLKAKEGDANKPWNKPGWPGPKKNDDESLRELEHIKKSIETLQKNAQQPAKDVSTATWQFSTHSFSPRSVVSVNGAKDDILKDDKPRGIMKRRELETRDQMMYAGGGQDNQIVKQYHRSQSSMSNKPSVTETVQRFEETRRTEEVERRVQRKERRERRSRHHSSSRHHSGREQWEQSGYNAAERRVASVPPIIYQQSTRAMNDDEIDKVVREAYEAADEARRNHYRGRSSSLSRGGQLFLPSNESYFRQTTTRRDRDSSGRRYEDEQFGGGLAHARYGSLSDSLRRGELKYVPNGEVRENGSRMHKSLSTRDVFSGDDRRSTSSHHRGSQQPSPFIEFPPTLPRRGDHHDMNYRPVSKSRSYADWDDTGRAGFGGRSHGRRYDDEMSRLEREMRDSTLLMPVPNGKLNERDHRTEQIPGGYETYHKENKANSGRRLGRDGNPVDFNEASHEYNYKREQEFDRRR